MVNPFKLLTRKFKSTGGLVGRIGQKLTEKAAMHNINDIGKMIDELKKDAKTHEMEDEIKIIQHVNETQREAVDDMDKLFEATTVVTDKIVVLDKNIRDFEVKKIKPSKVADKVAIMNEMAKRSKNMTTKALAQFKKEYQRLLSLIKTSGDIGHTVVVENMLMNIKKENIGYVDYFQMRGEYKAETNALRKAGSAFQEFKKRWNQIERAQNEKLYKSLKKQLVKEIDTIYDELERGFNNSYQAVMREILWLFVLQHKLEQYYREVEELNIEKEIPEKIAEDAEAHVRKIEAKLHDLTRTERIIVQKEYKAEDDTWIKAA